MERINQLVRANIQKLQPYSCARDEFSEAEGILLDANENPYGSNNRYPDPYQRALKERVAELRKVAVDQIFVGNGSDEVIDLLFRVFCEPAQDKCLIFTPTYGMYEVCAAINNVEVVRLPLLENFQLDVAAAVERLSDHSIKLTFICSPNNPTGNAMKLCDMEQIIQASRAIVVVDEAYIDFSGQPSRTAWVERFPNLVVLQTMSKSAGLAAIRVGFAIANESIINWLNKVKPPYNVSTPNQSIALQTLKNYEAIQQNCSSILAEKGELHHQLNALKSVVRIYPSDANFFLVKVTEAIEVYKALLHRGIVVRNRHSVISDCLRITVGSTEENKLLIETLQQIENEKSTVY